MWPFGKSTEDRVREAMDKVEIVRKLNLQMEERGGTVSFRGEVPNQNYHSILENVAEGIKGVKNVDLSGIRVRQQVQQPQMTGQQQASQHVPTLNPSSPQTASRQAPQEDLDLQQYVEQSKIAKAVLRRIEANVELKDDPIDVLQTGRSVILRGAVDSQHEYNLAEKIARETEGVASVDASGLRIVEQAKKQYQEALASQTQKKPQQQGYVNKPDEWHTVQSGDTLSGIALKYYGDASRDSYMKIAKANGISDPDKIRVGQKLQIPM